MRLPGALGVAQSVANHIRPDQSEQFQNMPPEYTALPHAAYSGEPNNPGVEALAKSQVVTSRHKMITRLGVTGLAVCLSGYIWSSCGGSGDTSFGSHEKAQVDTSHAQVESYTLTSDLDVADLGASNNTSLTGVGYKCWNPLTGGLCVPDSLHKVEVHNTGTLSLFLLKGTIITGRTDEKGNPSVELTLGNDNVETRLYNAKHTPNDGNHNIGWDAIFGDSNLQANLQSTAENFGSDSLQATLTHSLDSQVRVVDASIAQGLRSEIAMNSGLLKPLDANGSSLLAALSKPDTTYVFDHKGEKLDIQLDHPREYQPGEKTKVGGVSITFGKDGEATFNTDSATTIGNLAHDQSVIVTHEPSIPESDTPPTQSASSPSANSQRPAN